MDIWDAWFYGWSDGELACLGFFLCMMVGFLVLGVIGFARMMRDRREERELSSRPPPVLVELLPPGPPVPPTFDDRLEAVGLVFADIEDIKFPPPRLACTVAFTRKEGGCGYCEDGAVIGLYEIDADRAAWPLMTFCACGGYQLKEPWGSDVLGAWYEWHDDVFEMLADLEERGPGSIDETRHRLLFAHRNVLQGRVDVLTTALISLQCSVARRRRDRAWRETTAA